MDNLQRQPLRDLRVYLNYEPHSEKKLIAVRTISDINSYRPVTPPCSEVRADPDGISLQLERLNIETSPLKKRRRGRRCARSGGRGRAARVSHDHAPANVFTAAPAKKRAADDSWDSHPPKKRSGITNTLPRDVDLYAQFNSPVSLRSYRQQTSEYDRPADAYSDYYGNHVAYSDHYGNHVAYSDYYGNRDAYSDYHGNHDSYRTASAVATEYGNSANDIRARYSTDVSYYVDNTVNAPCHYRGGERNSKYDVMSILPYCQKIINRALETILSIIRWTVVSQRKYVTEFQLMWFSHSIRNIVADRITEVVMGSPVYFSAEIIDSYLQRYPILTDGELGNRLRTLHGSHEAQNDVLVYA